MHYRIYVVNQADSNLFNRAMLLNVGFKVISLETQLENLYVVAP